MRVRCDACDNAGEIGGMINCRDLRNLTGWDALHLMTKESTVGRRDDSEGAQQVSDVLTKLHVTQGPGPW